MSLTHKLLKGSIFRTLNVFLQIAVAFVMTPLIVHSLGNRMYGYWVFIGTFLGYYGLLDLGISSAVNRYISRSIGQNDPKEINKIVNTSIIIFSIIGLIVLLITTILLLASQYFIYDVNELDLFRLILGLSGISAAIGFPVRVFVGIISAHIRYDFISYAEFFKLLIANLAIFILIKNGFGILALAVTSFVTGILQYGLLLFFARLAFPKLSINFASFDRSIVKRLFDYSWKTFISQVADILRFKIDALVIAAYLGIGSITIYTIGAKFINYFEEIMVNSIGVMAPVYSQHEGKNDYDAIRTNFLEISHLAVIMSAFIGTSVIFYSKWFITRWMGPGFESSYYVTVILGISATIAYMQNTGISLLYGISKHQYYAIANSCEGILNLILSLILVRFYGIYGVALGTSIAMLLFKLFVQPVVVCKSINLSIYRYYFEVIFITALKSFIPLFLYFYIIKNYIEADYASIILFASLQCLLFALHAYLFILSSKTKSRLKNFLTLLF